MKDPKALQLADEMGGTRYRDVADELRRQHHEIDDLRQWIRDQGAQTDTCTYNILREKCSYCQCNRSKT
jgi:hypothetical protein